jgi:8-oxo-dGTP pyrophosphatase MutT (NUDIX family)
MNEYIKSLRKKIGHDLIIQCGASVIVLNEQNEILLQLRKDNSCWGYAGGAVEPNEPVEEAAKRELYEETGLIANKLELFGVFSGPDLHYIYPNGDEVSNVDIVYLCKDYSGGSGGSNAHFTSSEHSVFDRPVKGKRHMGHRDGY